MRKAKTPEEETQGTHPEGWGHTHKQQQQSSRGTDEQGFNTREGNTHVKTITNYIQGGAQRKIKGRKCRQTGNHTIKEKVNTINALRLDDTWILTCLHVIVNEVGVKRSSFLLIFH